MQNVAVVSTSGIFNKNPELKNVLQQEKESNKGGDKFTQEDKNKLTGIYNKFKYFQNAAINTALVGTALTISSAVAAKLTSGPTSTISTLVGGAVGLIGIPALIFCTAAGIKEHMKLNNTLSEMKNQITNSGQTVGELFASNNNGKTIK